MAKKEISVVFLNDDNTRNCEWTVVVEDSGSISVYKDGKLEKNSKDALRGIADYIGFNYDEGWNTRQFGSKLVDYMNEEAAKDAKKSSKADTSKSKNKKTDSTTKDQKKLISEIFATLAWVITSIDDEIAKEELEAILGIADEFEEFDFDIVKQRIILETKGIRNYDSHSALARQVPEEHRLTMLKALTMVALSDFKVKENELDIIAGLCQIWDIDQEVANNVVNKLADLFRKSHPNRELEIE